MPDAKKVTKVVIRRVVKSLSVPDRDRPHHFDDVYLTPAQIQRIRDRELFEVRCNRP